MLLDYLVCGLGWAIIAWHTWALKHHFDMPKVPFGVRIISLLVLSSGAVLTYMVFKFSQPQLPQIFSIVMLLFSAYLFWRTMQESKKAKLLAAFDEKMPHGLLKTGPYSKVRHPFYTSYLMQWIGWAIAAWTPWAIIPVVAMCITYYNAATGEEKKFAATDMAKEYADYMKVTGRFFPKFTGK